MVESPQAAEPIPNPERLASHNSVALQIRLYLGGEAVTYPPVQIKEVTGKRVQSEHDRNQEDTMKKLGICAAFEGQEEWSKGEKGQLKHDEKVASWAKEVEGVFQNEGSKTHQQILKEINTLGGINMTSVNQETARRLYDRYVRKQEGEKDEAVSFGNKTLYIPSNIKRFVDDVIAAHTENGVVNYSRLESHLSSFIYLAGMFGQNTSQLLHDYITASIRFTKDASSQQTFLQELSSNNRINTLTSEEDTRLKWFYEVSTGTSVITSVVQQNLESKTSSDWERLAKSLGGEDIESPIWKNALQIREAFLNSGISKKDLPVYYPGAADDIFRSLIFTDATQFVFVDPLYSNTKVSLTEDLYKSIEKIGGKIIRKPKVDGVLGKGGKQIIDFEWNGKKRQIIMYSEDATRPDFKPKEIENGTSFIILGGRPAGSSEIGHLESIKHYAKLYNQLKPGSFINRSITQYLSSELFGLKTIIPQPSVMGKADTYSNGFALTQKVSHEPDSQQLFEIEGQILTAINIRGGMITNEIVPNTLSDYENSLKDLRTLVEAVSEAKKPLIYKSLRNILLPDSLSEKDKRIIMSFGKSYGLTNNEAIKKYIDQSAEIALRVFPELEEKQTKADEFLKQPLSPKSSPAVRILEYQMNKALDYYKAQGLRIEELAQKLSDNFLCEKDLSPQGFYGKLSGESAADFQIIDDGLSSASGRMQIRKEIKDVLESVRQKPSRPFKVDNIDLAFHVYSPLYKRDEYFPKENYRIYLNPNDRYAPELLKELIKYGEVNPLYFKVFYSKSDNPRARLDEFVLYLTDDNVDQIMEYLLAYSKKNPEVFRGRLTPGGSTISLADGIGLAYHYHQATGTQINASRIEKATKTALANYLDTTLSRFSTEAAWLSSRECKIFSYAFSKFTNLHYFLHSTYKKFSQYFPTAESQKLLLDTLARVLFRNKSKIIADLKSLKPNDMVATLAIRETLTEQLRDKGDMIILQKLRALSDADLRIITYATLLDVERGTLAVYFNSLLSQGRPLGDFFKENNIV